MLRVSLPRRRGSILILAMFVLFALAGMTLVLARSMATEAQASANQAAVAQVACIERGAEQYVLAMLSDQGGQAAMNLDAQDFSAVPVGTGYFWVVRPVTDDASTIAFGLVEECVPQGQRTSTSPKVNLNYLNPRDPADPISGTYENLIKLPGMTDDIADSINDWRDPDEESTDGGAESSAYSSLAQPYNAKNDRFETVEELLLVRGMTPAILYGDKASSDIDLRRGLFDRVTVWGAPVPGTQGEIVPHYSADIVAVSGNGRAFRRCRIVVRVRTGETPQIVYRRDLTDRGWPLEPELLQQLRAGRGVGVSNGLAD